jgi:DNA-binding NarL/FixJ family response regulator
MASERALFASPSILVIGKCDLLVKGIQEVIKPYSAHTGTHLTDALAAVISNRIQPEILILVDYGYRIEEILPRIRERFPNIIPLIVTPHCNPVHIYSLMQQDVRGCLCLEDSLIERIPQAIRDLLEGGAYLSPTVAAAMAQIEHYTRNVQPRLTPYQLDVLRLMGQHWSGGRIAAQLGRSTTAIYQVQRFLRDLFEVETNGELLDCAVQLGILPDTRRISA